MSSFAGLPIELKQNIYNLLPDEKRNDFHSVDKAATQIYLPLFFKTNSSVKEACIKNFPKVLGIEKYPVLKATIKNKDTLKKVEEDLQLVQSLILGFADSKYMDDEFARIDKLRRKWEEEKKLLVNELNKMRTGTIWDRLRTYICRPNSLLNCTLGKILRLFNSVRTQLNKESKVEERMRNYLFREQVIEKGNYPSEKEHYAHQAKISSYMEKMGELKQRLNKVFIKKEVWDCFGGKEKFLQLPQYQVPDDENYVITPEDMGKNSIMRGVDSDGNEFFIIKARVGNRPKEGQAAPSKAPTEELTQMLIFDKVTRTWKTVGDRMIRLDGDKEYALKNLKLLVERGNDYYKTPRGQWTVYRTCYYQLDNPPFKDQSQ